MLRNIRIKEIIVIVLLVAFIVFVNLREHYTVVSADEIFGCMEETLADNELEHFSASQIKKDFGINVNDFGGAVYYGHESVMECEQVLIVVLKDEKQGQALLDTINKQIETNKELYQSYAPEQYKLIDKAVAEQKGKYVLYVVSDESVQLEKIFMDCIRNGV